MSDQVERNKANFKRFQQEVIVGGDFSLLPELMAPEMKVHRSANDSMVKLEGKTIPENRVWTHDQFIKGYQAAIGGAEDHRRTIEEIYGEGDVVCAKWTIERRHSDDRLGVASDQLIRSTEVGFIRFDDQGRMIEGWFMLDPLDIYEQAGAKVTIAVGA